MNPSHEFKIISKHRMINHYFIKLKICIESLRSEELWFQESEDSNSIGGIINHILEHISRNTNRIRNKDVQYQSGIENMFINSNQDKELLVEELEQSFLAFEEALKQADTVDMYNIYHLVEHTGYHLGQIVDRAQRITGTEYQFVQNGINEKALKEQIERELKS